jgi:YbbR domain-containing protein
LRIEKVLNKDVPVKANIVGQNEMAPGYEMASYQCQPAQVKITGPESSIKRLNFVPTEIIDVSGFTIPFKRTVNLSLADPHIEVSNSPQIDVNVKIISKELQSRATPSTKK